MEYGCDGGHAPSTRLMRAASEHDRLGGLYETLGDFCHAYRNRLHSLGLTLYLARRGGAISAEEGARVEAHYRQIERLVDQLQWVCRPAEVKPMPLDLGMLIEERRSAWAEPFACRGCALEFVGDPGAVNGWFDPCRLATALEALAAWRSEVVGPGMIVEVGHRVDGDEFVVTWAEAGGGEGTRPAADDTSGSLALGMLGRVMADHRGTLRLADGDSFGVSLRWPTQVGDRCAGVLGRPAARTTLTGHASRA